MYAFIVKIGEADDSYGPIIGDQSRQDLNIKFL
jgi:hypothetical protein